MSDDYDPGKDAHDSYFAAVEAKRQRGDTHGWATTLDPFVRQMRDAESDAARALVLLSAPLFTLMRWKDVFREHCRRAAFDEGGDYLDALTEALARPRHLGKFTTTAPDALAIKLLWIADGGAARERGPGT